MCRRAKAKLFDGKQDQEFPGFPLDAPPPLSAGYDAELNALVHEAERKWSTIKLALFTC